MYQIEEHRHRFAAWAAGRAASVNRCRFTVEQARMIIETIELHESAKSIVNMPSPELFDVQHRQWRAKAIETASGMDIPMTHGVAAKLINIYLKSILVCAGHHDDPRGMVIHPPIDSLFLNDLYERNVAGLSALWNTTRNIKWSKLNSDQYEAVIKGIKTAIGSNRGLWCIEQYWRGYQ